MVIQTQIMILVAAIIHGLPVNLKQKRYLRINVPLFVRGLILIPMKYIKIVLVHSQMKKCGYVHGTMNHTSGSMKWKMSILPITVHHWLISRYLKRLPKLAQVQIKIISTSRKIPLNTVSARKAVHLQDMVFAGKRATLMQKVVSRFRAHYMWQLLNQVHLQIQQALYVAIRSSKWMVLIS